MKLSDLKPCAKCGGPLTGKEGGPRHMTWYTLRWTTAVLNPRAANETLGLAQMFGGSVTLAEAMGAEPERAVVLLGDEKESGGWKELHMCFDCVTSDPALCELLDVE